MKILALLFSLFPICVFAQVSCPPNIGFEAGSFENWQLYKGKVAEDGRVMVEPGAGNQSLFSTANFTEKDKYGDFPIAPPDGSRYCVKMGSDLPDQKADRLVYAFTVPSNAEGFSIVFNYAVVLQNADHEEHEQPRFTVNVFNETKAAYIECSSFDFVIGFNDPDFQASPVDAQVFYKPWSSAAINLAAYKGDRLRLEFTVTDCAKGGHFGYAYFDVMEKCSNSVTGNIICPGVGNINLHAPDHFAGYQWFTGNFSQPLGTGKSHTVNAPAVGDSFAVVLVPFSYLGCRDTFYTRLTSVSDPIQLVVKDSVNGCSDGGADLTRPEVTQGSSPLLKLEYYSDADATQPVANPEEIKTSGVYYIRALNEAGCVQTKPVVLNILSTPLFDVTEPDAVAYPQTVNLTTVMDNNQLVYTYWEDPALTKQVAAPDRISESGTYFIKGANAAGCFFVKTVAVKVAPAVFVPNAFTPNGDGKNDRFVYTALGRFKEISFFKIFNRWGQEVFNAGSAGASWDGTYNGKPVENGTYVWMLRATDWLNKVHTAKGTVLLIR